MRGSSTLMNAKSGSAFEALQVLLTVEDLLRRRDSSQSCSADKILAGAEAAYKLKSKTYCIVIQACGPNGAARFGRRNDRPAGQAGMAYKVASVSA